MIPWWYNSRVTSTKGISAGESVDGGWWMVDVDGDGDGKDGNFGMWAVTDAFLVSSRLINL